MSMFLENNNLSWANLCGICTDGAPAMIGSRSGFQALVKHRAPAVKGVHCLIHRQSLASKTLPEPLSNVLQQSINLSNYIKGSASNTWIFKELCEEKMLSAMLSFFIRKYTGFRKGTWQQESFSFGMTSKILVKNMGNVILWRDLIMTNESWVWRILLMFLSNPNAR